VTPDEFAEVIKSCRCIAAQELLARALLAKSANDANLAADELSRNFAGLSPRGQAIVLEVLHPEVVSAMRRAAAV
jgi:hypothetical protein